MDTAVLQATRSLYALPGSRHLDKHPVNVNAFGLIKLNDAFATGEGGVAVKTQSGIDLCRHPARDDGQNLAAKAHQQAVHGFVQGPATEFGHGVGQQWLVIGLLYGLENERWVGGRVLRLEGVQLLEIPGVRNDGGVLFERFELIHGKSVGWPVQGFL